MICALLLKEHLNISLKTSLRLRPRTSGQELLFRVVDDYTHNHPKFYELGIAAERSL
jgi:hypothetical protein